MPFGGLVEWLDRLPEPQATAGTIAVGVLAGLVVAGIGTAERLVVTVEAAQVRLRRSDQNQTVARADARVVYLADKHLVLLDADGAELARSRRTCRPTSWQRRSGRTAGAGPTTTRTGRRTDCGCRTCPGCPPGGRPAARPRTGGRAGPPRRRP
ncbi:hypothetical protein NKG94_28020 [Micromonospora sp. M12]